MESPFIINEVKLSYKLKQKASERPQLKNSDSVYQLLLKCYDSDTIDYTESFKVILLNRSNKVLGVMNVSQGGLDSTVVDIRLILQSVLLSNATNIIISHNHPSGALYPSHQDNSITKRIKEACEFMNIQVLDHLILTSEGYYSYANEGKL